MATRKTSTRGKTKTTNAKSAHSSRSASARTSRAKTTTTTKAAAPARTARPARGATNMLGLRRILAMAAGLYAILAVAAAVLMNRSTYEVMTNYATKDTLLSRAATVFAPASQVLYDLEIRWALVALLAFSIILPLLYLTKMERPYTARLRGRTIPWRWIDLGASSALMIEVVALMAGVQDVVALKALGGLAAVSAVFGWLSERENEMAGVPVWGAYTAALLTGVLAWVLVGISILSATYYGLVRLPWFVYALFGSMALGFLLVAFNQLNQHRRFKTWANYMNVERNYLLLNALTKAAFAVILIVGLRAK